MELYLLYKHIFMSHFQNEKQNNGLIIPNKSLENVSKFKYEYMGITVINRNRIEEHIKGKLKSWKVCYRSVQNPLSFLLVSKT